MNPVFLNDLDFDAGVQTYIRPWLASCLLRECIHAEDGTKLAVYYAHHPHEKGAVVILHGFCEFFGKYHETAWMLYQAGFSVYFVEFRGHGHSQRFITQNDRVYIDTFDSYLKDADALVKQVVLLHSPDVPVYLLAHSMGGCVGALLMEQQPGLFSKAVLSSPMLSLNYHNLPGWKVKAMTAATQAAHMDVQLAPGAHGWSNAYTFEHSSARSQVRYNYQFHLRQADPMCQTNGATCAWVRAAESAMDQAVRKADVVMTPVLMMAAGQDSMVTEEGQKAFSARALHAECIFFPDSKHEIFNSLDDDRKKWYSQIISFFH